MPIDPKLLEDAAWRLSNLYYIVDEAGTEILFTPNATQADYLDREWWFNIILKSRQHGFTTLLMLIALDMCVFTPNFSAGIIAHGLKEAKAIFEDKVKFAYDRLPLEIRERVYPINDSKEELRLSNGSKLVVGTSMRGGTLQWLHITEFGKICARYPEKAREIITGSLNTVHVGQRITIESTAEGQEGRFFEMSTAAENMALERRALTELDYKFHFYAWWMDAKNRLDPANVPIPESMERYFADLEKANPHIRLDGRQRAWYVKKAETQKGDMKREHPSTPKEAFEGAIEGAIYANQMAWLRGHDRLRVVPLVPSEPVNTFWDLGRNDVNAIWFHQYIAAEHRFFLYYENAHEDLAHYVKYIKDELPGVVWGTHYLPHDGDQENLERGESRVDRLEELKLPGEIVTVDRIEDVMVGIELTRKMLPRAFFDRAACEKGIKALDNYKFEWDEKHGVWRNKPAHTWASNGADAIRQWAQGWQPGRVKTKKKEGGRRESWRTA